MHNYHCSKCKKLCKKKNGKWKPNCKCGIRCSPNWAPPNPASFSEGITRTFSLTEPEPELEPEPKPIGEWLSQGSMDPVKKNEVKKGVKVVPKRIEKKTPDKPSVRAYRVKKGVKVAPTRIEKKTPDKSSVRAYRVKKGVKVLPKRIEKKTGKSKKKSRKIKSRKRKSRNKSKEENK